MAALRGWQRRLDRADAEYERGVELLCACSVCVCVCVCVCPSLSLSVSPSLSVYLCLCLGLTVCLQAHEPACLFLYTPLDETWIANKDSATGTDSA